MQTQAGNRRTAWRTVHIALALMASALLIAPATAAEQKQQAATKTQTAAAAKQATAASSKKASTKKKSSTPKKSTAASKSKKKPVKKAKLSKAASKAAYRPLPLTAGEQLGLRGTRDQLALKSSVALIVDQQTQEVLFAKNSDAVLPIASLTKLMTALVAVEAHLPLDETLEITQHDVDTEKHSQSRLAVGTKLTREDMLLLALMSSENRAASALGRNYPGGSTAFVAAMNRKAQALGMQHSQFADATGLSSRNVASAADLVRLTNAAYKEPLIREFSTRKEHTVQPGRHLMTFGSSNRLIRYDRDWDIGLQKTGFTNEAGRCLVMQATVEERPLVMVFLDSTGTLTRFADAARVRKWLQQEAPHQGPQIATARTHSES